MFQSQYGQGIGEAPTFKAGQDFLTQLFSGSPEATQRFEAPALRQFHEQIVPQIAERFAGVGALSSSGFQQALSHAGGDLSERLAALRGNMQLGALGPALSYAGAPSNQAQGLLGSAFGPSFSTGLTPQRPTALSELLAALLGGAGQGLGLAATGGMGGMFGSNLKPKGMPTQGGAFPESIYADYRARGGP